MDYEIEDFEIEDELEIEDFEVENELEIEDFDVDVAYQSDIVDVTINDVSVVSDKIANIVTKGEYNSSTNKIITESDMPTAGDGISIYKGKIVNLGILSVTNSGLGATDGSIKITRGNEGSETVYYVKPKGINNSAFRDVDTEITDDTTSTNLPTSQAVANYVASKSRETFENDITLAGNWTQVGNLTKSQTGTAVYQAQGKTPVQVITDILSQDANPTTTQPSVSISLSNSGNVEVGNSISVNVTTNFNSGSYTYDNSTGVTASSYAFTDNKSHSDTNTTGSTNFNNYSLLVEDNTNYTASVTVSYTAGNIPHTQLGNEYPAGKIQAGTKTKTSSAIKGVRYMFNGANTEVKTLNSTNIRALSGSNVSNSFSITIPNNCMQVLIAFPKSLNKTLSKVEDVGAFGTDIKARFEKSTVSVEGANSYTAVDYDVWEYKPATKLDANTYRVTMS